MRVRCYKCGHEWDCNSDLLWVTCPSCQKKVEVERCKVHSRMDLDSLIDKQWELDDESLATPEHDELLLMLLDKGYLSSKVGAFIEGVMCINGIKAQESILNEEGMILGFFDIIAWGYRKTETGEEKDLIIAIEVKPQISNLAKTIRQLCLFSSLLQGQYNARLSENSLVPPLQTNERHMCLFTRDLRSKAAFESQGIIVFSP